MIIHEVTEECFKKYGKVIDSIDLTELVSTMQTVEIPADVVYEPSISALEKLKCATELQQKTYGELPIQIGWCIGNNHKLNAVEYHRCSEVNIAATDAILDTRPTAGCLCGKYIRYLFDGSFQDSIRNSSRALCHNTALRTM